ncbi:hypothetical protein [Usitatibacter palustris]|uniref:DUF5648 domain-containing protein n=1 Tax=Usitatibacter palustris TaxID=2732487 RepID=A0A6M4HBR3_9PROT|nr:hypothetical protein [Usitatibacter palustris]QJR15934.1 hypothetical protein DSM104440_02761 [Usitatibacter palustris]
MNRLPLLVTIALVSTAALAQQPTSICNPRPWDNKLSLQYGVPASDSRIQSMIAAVQNPASNPALYDRMQRPTGINATSSSMTLTYDPIQEPSELGNRLQQDSQLAAPFSSITPLSTGCGTAVQTAPVLRLVEYYNGALNRYYLSANGDEMGWLDAGGGGGGWSRTGQIWSTHAPAQPVCNQPAYQPVFQFYSAERHAHYYTLSPQECGWLRTNNGGWSYVATPFGALPPTCTGDATTPISMFYNPQDPSHRYSSNILISESMRAQGWQGYGVQMCVTSLGN